MKISVASICFTVATLVPVAAIPAGNSNTTDYAITISGLPLAKASFRTNISGRNFTISGGFSTVGLVNAFKKWSGTAAVTGRVGERGFQAENYKTNYSIGSSKRGFEVIFSGGNVKRAVRNPHRGTFPDGWIPVSKTDLRSISDPMTAFILPYNGKACHGVVPIFDGETRMELHLSPKGHKTYRKYRVAVEAEVCRVDFRLKSGYHKGHNDLEKVQNLRGFEVWLAKSPIADVYAPVKLQIPTQFGTLAVSATRFGR